MTITASTKMRIKRGDQVVVRTGRDKGKTGEVLRVDREQNRVLVQGVNMMKRHQRPTQTSPGGINEFEAMIHVSNVALIDPDTSKPTRVGYKTLDDGRKVRFAKRSGEIIDQ
ncbi:MAG TPA: 50S ribosomal protein L24 [Rhodospirillaceae bacterium]|nr:50S ribosomal protein L24 [Rhodospirillaceae bacterium]